MMVIPQIPNFKPAIVLAAFFFFVTSVFSISSYRNSSEDNYSLAQEKKLILNELSEMIDGYESVDILNDSLRFQLQESKERLVLTLDSVKVLKPNKTLFLNFRTQMKRLRIEKENILALVRNLESENQSLKIERQTFEKMLTVRDSITTLIESKYKHLLEENIEIADNKTLFVSNLYAEGAKRINSKKRVIDTKYASKTKKFHVEFTIVKNEFLVKGPKTFYFQILNSKMNVIADKGTVSFDKKSLIYSGKKTVDYNGQEVSVSAIIDKEEKEKLTAGVYYVSIINKGDVISKTSITLK